MRLHPLALAFLLTGISAQSQATDFLQAYEMARLSDPQLAAAEALSNAQGQGVVEARAALLPQINADGSYSKTNSDSNGSQAVGAIIQPASVSSNQTNSKSYGVTLRQSIYDYGNYSRLGASKSRASQAEADYDAANDALIIRTADAYFNVLTAIETLASSRAEERAVKRQLDQADKRLEVGLAPITDVYEARARYDSARANTITASNTLDDTREILAEITGQPIENIRGLSPDFEAINTDTRTVEEWVTIALASNPSLISRKMALAAAEKDIATARAAYYPSLSAFANWRDNGSDGTNDLFSPITSSTIFENDSNSNTIGVQLTVPIFAGLGNQARVRQATYQRDAVADQLEQGERAVTRLTRNSYRALVAGQAEVAARQVAVVSAKAAKEAGEAGLEVGTRTIVDVLIAQQQLYVAQREFARSRHAFLVNILRLRQAAGVLEIGDVQSVNSHLTADANAPLVND